MKSLHVIRQCTCTAASTMSAVQLCDMVPWPQVHDKLRGLVKYSLQWCQSEVGQTQHNYWHQLIFQHKQVWIIYQLYQLHWWQFPVIQHAELRTKWRTAVGWRSQTLSSACDSNSEHTFHWFPLTELIASLFETFHSLANVPVSYTHLTLPTNREV